MVDVGGKSETRRAALARARLRFPKGVLAPLWAGKGPKGPVRDVARVAGILAAKRTSEIVPLCHPVALEVVEIRFRRAGPSALEITCRVACTGATGVEMEALVGASAAALTVYDMAKALDHGIRIERVELLEKRGGRSGTWRSRAR
jgi:cyclic pyranopterin phosphate synthase